YESARARLWLAEALTMAGSRDGARLEAGAAREVFVRLRAEPDGARATALLSELGSADADAGPRRQVTRTLLFTDIVRSTDLIEAIGDEAWEGLRSWHDNTIRSLARDHGGEEVDHAGDGFFIAFASADRAIDCALAIRETMRSHRKQHGFAPSLRIGLHTASTMRSRAGYGGAGVHAAARIASLAGADEIVVSEATLAAATTAVPHAPAREERLKGIRRPTRVASLS
ncbi:MAG TPA: adenylate/guanylate cyclase domain-containing protein, partial [Candidatus Dormibacteraeota bacterium]|nr:adenylate/guanylate cyclase domain-containing protein [Candidatus Dormibacteraeota bacterium]